MPEGGKHSGAPARPLPWEWSEPSVVPDSFRVLHTQETEVTLTPGSYGVDVKVLCGKSPHLGA